MTNDPMDARLKEQFDDDGFVILEQLYPPDVLKEAKEQILQFIEETPGKLNNGVQMGLARRSELFRSMATNERLVLALKEIIGDRVLFMSDKTVYKSAKIVFPTAWHQDYSYWKGSHKISVWIALDDATPDNGCLRFIPGSHHNNIEHDLADPSDNGFRIRLRESDIDESKAISAAVKAGSSIIFHDLLIHGSHPNTA
ncbi:MAG: phytanoyl-CoA dioxygenase family protein, partial [Paenibacillaceae bacterium]|nr:phytanoyl-CoA dioxygenase family protein [Paenibacillaceae bacterium]